jgi:hypothetical protein
MSLVSLDPDIQRASLPPVDCSPGVNRMRVTAVVCRTGRGEFAMKYGLASGGFMSSKSRAILAGMLLTLGLAGTTVANAGPPRAVAARPVTVRPQPASGISPGEAARIRYQVHQHHQMQRRAGADGEVSRHEHGVLARDAAQVRRMIHVAGTN